MDVMDNTTRHTPSAKRRRKVLLRRVGRRVHGREQPEVLVPCHRVDVAPLREAEASFRALQDDMSCHVISCHVTSRPKYSKEEKSHASTKKLEVKHNTCLSGEGECVVRRNRFEKNGFPCCVFATARRDQFCAQSKTRQ